MDKLELFLSFEEKHRLFNLEYKGIHYWHLVRFNIYCKILHGEETLSIHPDNANKSFIEKLGFIPHIPAQIKQYFNPIKYDVLLSAPFIEKNINGRLVNPFTQFMIDSYDYKCNRNTLFFGNWKKRCPSGHNNALLNAFLVPHRIVCELLTINFKNKHNQHILKIVEGLNKLFSTNLNPVEILKITGWITLEFNIIKSYYKHIIKNKYRCIFISSHYDIWQFALIAAARECCIPTIEHQHGMIGRHHTSYNFKDTRPVGKYLPNYLFTFGDYWTSTTRLPSGTTAISVGFPLMDESLKRYKNVVRNLKTVVFYSYGSIGAKLSRLAIQFSEIAVPLGYKIIYKFHPSECLTWRNRYPWLASAPNIECEDSPINIHEILANAKHHVSINSTVLFEALAFGGFVYIWNVEEKGSYLDDVIQEGYAQPFDTGQQLFDQISSASSDKDIEAFAQQFYKSDSENNILNALNEIMGKK